MAVGPRRHLGLGDANGTAHVEYDAGLVLGKQTVAESLDQAASLFAGGLGQPNPTSGRSIMTR